VDEGHATDEQLLDRLRRGDEAAYVALVGRHHATMTRVARAYVASDDVAAEVVQETWVAVVRGLERFEGRSSLKTWLFRILTNRAKTRGTREGRTIPLSALSDDDRQPGLSADHFDSGGGWNAPPSDWTSPERLHRDTELRAQLSEAIEGLPERQRLVLTLRDVKGWAADEVCNALQISETNQRVLLHRARTKVRAWLADRLESP
jgi:RNA polymerase sigma-70 factor (ECF subfamily)